MDAGFTCDQGTFAREIREATDDGAGLAAFIDTVHHFGDLHQQAVTAQVSARALRHAVCRWSGVTDAAVQTSVGS